MELQVVRVSSTSVRDELIASLGDMLRTHGRPLLQHETTTKLMLSRAVTKKKRQEMLALFFRSVFAEVRLYAFVLFIIDVLFQSSVVYCPISQCSVLHLCPSSCEQYVQYRTSDL